MTFMGRRRGSNNDLVREFRELAMSFDNQMDFAGAAMSDPRFYELIDMIRENGIASMFPELSMGANRGMNVIAIDENGQIQGLNIGVRWNKKDAASVIEPTVPRRILRFCRPKL